MDVSNFFSEMSYEVAFPVFNDVTQNGKDIKSLNGLMLVNKAFNLIANNTYFLKSLAISNIKYLHNIDFLNDYRKFIVISNHINSKFKEAVLKLSPDNPNYIHYIGVNEILFDDFNYGSILMASDKTSRHLKLPKEKIEKLKIADLSLKCEWNDCLDGIVSSIIGANKIVFQSVIPTYDGIKERFKNLESLYFCREQKENKLLESLISMFDITDMSFFNESNFVISQNSCKELKPAYLDEITCDVNDPEALKHLNQWFAADLFSRSGFKILKDFSIIFPVNTRELIMARLKNVNSQQKEFFEQYLFEDKVDGLYFQFVMGGLFKEIWPNLHQHLKIRNTYKQATDIFKFNAFLLSGKMTIQNEERVFFNYDLELKDKVCSILLEPDSQLKAYIESKPYSPILKKVFIEVWEEKK